MSTLTDLLTAITNSTTSSGAANAIGLHLQQQNNMETSVKALVSIASPANVQQVAAQIAAVQGVPTTITPLLTELSQSTTQQEVTAIGLQIEAALQANSSSLGNVLTTLF